MKKKKQHLKANTKSANATKKTVEAKPRRRLPFYLAAGLLFLLPVSYFGVDRYYTGKIDTRFEQHAEAEKQLGYKEESRSDFANYSLPKKIKYIRRIESMERNVTEDLPILMEFIGRNDAWKKIVDLTSRNSETYGYVETAADGLTITPRTRIRDEIRSYVSEMLGGDFRHSEEFLNYYDSVPTFFQAGENPPSRKMMAEMLRGMNLFSIYQRTPGKDRANFPSLPILQSIDELGRRYFTALEKNLPWSSFFVIDDEFLDNDRIFSRFHTHPVEDPSYFPSIPDKANTYTLGPNVLMSQTGGKIHIYVINHGDSKEIMTRAVR